MKNLSFFFICFVFCNFCLGQTVPSYVSMAGLKAWYPFTGNAMDSSGNGNNGVVLGPVLTSDRYGHPNSAYHFNGILDHILSDSSFFNSGWSNYTVSCWSNSDTISNPNNAGNSQILINTIPFNGIAIDFNWHLSNKFSFWVGAVPNINNWNILYNAISASDVTVHNWNHLVLVKKNDTAYRFYINGVLDTMRTSTILPVSVNCRILIGSTDSVFSNETFFGKLDDYGIWNRALSNCEIKRLYNANVFLYLTAQPANDTAVPTATAHFSVTDTGAGNTYQWQVNTGSGYSNLTGATPYSGVTTPTLTITPVVSVMNNYKYRCVVSGAQVCVDTSAFGKLTVISTGISNVNIAENISLAPNPTTGDVFINGTGKVGVKVYNELGVLVKESVQDDKISIAELPVGIYLIKLFDRDGLLFYCGKVVKE